MRLLLTRPTDDSAVLATKLAEHGISSMIEPMLEIAYTACTSVAEPDLTGVQGILVTSANGIRAFAKVSERRDLSIWTVGPGSAAEAQALGFAQVRHGTGDVGALADMVLGHVNADAGILLHVAGTRLAGDLAGRLEGAGYTYRRAVLYDAHPALELSTAARQEIRDGTVSGVALYSPRTAEAFVDLIKAAGLVEACAMLTAFCLSTAVVEKITMVRWQRVEIAETPHEDSLVRTVLRVAEHA